MALVLLGKAGGLLVLWQLVEGRGQTDKYMPHLTELGGNSSYFLWCWNQVTIRICSDSFYGKKKKFPFWELMLNLPTLNIVN